MRAIGMIETRGLLAAIESADAMLKAAEVVLIDRSFVGGGLVTVTVSGDVAAVKASVDAGASAVERIHGSTLISRHVIPRPNEELDDMVVPGMIPDSGELTAKKKEAVKEPIKASAKEPSKVKASDKEKTVLEAKEAVSKVVEPKPSIDRMDKKAVDEIMDTEGIDAVTAVLKGMRVVKLRNLAREYDGLGIAGRAISEANKQVLLKELTVHYKKK